MTLALTPEREKEIREELRLSGGGGVEEELLAEIDMLRADLAKDDTNPYVIEIRHEREALRKERDLLKYRIDRLRAENQLQSEAGETAHHYKQERDLLKAQIANLIDPNPGATRYCLICNLETLEAKDKRIVELKEIIRYTLSMIDGIKYELETCDKASK